MSENTVSRYTVVGAGAIGGTLAAHLHAAGHDVQVIDADAAHIAAIRDQGLRIDQPQGQLHAAVPVFDLATAPDQLGAVLLAVKSQATASAIDWIAPRLDADGWVVSMQNGLNEARIAQAVGPARTVSAFVDLFADVTGPGVVKDGGFGTIALGEYAAVAGERISPRIRRLAADLSHWGQAQLSENVDGFLWSKLAFGAMLTASAFVDADMAIVIDDHRSEMLALAREIYSVTDALGLELEAFDAFTPNAYRTSASAAETSAAFTELCTWLSGQTKTRSGIWRDLNVRKRPTEVPAQYRPVLDIAAEHGLHLPATEEMLTIIGELEQGVVAAGGPLFDRLETRL